MIKQNIPKLNKKKAFFALDTKTGKKIWITEKQFKERKPIMRNGIEIGFKYD